MTDTAPIWPDLSRALPANGMQDEHARSLLRDYLQRGYLGLTNTQLLRLDDAVIARFYALLAEERLADAAARSLPAAAALAGPAAGRPDSSWMADSDFCFVNIRATGLDDAPGNLLTACKLFPGIRADALHLGPFTRYALGGCYSIDSTRTIAGAIIHAALDAAGIDAHRQMRALIEAAHLLGKTVGFDLEPHVAQFAVTVVMQPHCFRWIELTPERDALADGLPPEQAAREDVQRRIVAKVAGLRDRALRRAGLDTLEEQPGDDAARLAYKQAVHQALTGELIGFGLWTIPSQAWNCLGLPEFAGYHHEGGYARFRYRTPAGEDAHHQAFHTLTPFKFHRDLPVNAAPASRPEPEPDAIDAFAGIFGYWRDGFGFDFVRFDSVDHIVDSAHPDDDGHALSDRPTPAILRRLVQAHKSPDRPWIGNLAERMGNEIDDYLGMGFDAMLGNDMLMRIDRRLLEKSFDLHRRLCRANQAGRRFAVTFAVDTHDTGNENLWGEPLIRVMGFERMRLRHFVSRFIGCGAARRPKYEVMGLSDLSYGLYRSNVAEVNLHWQDDARFARCYHRLEDVYDGLRAALGAGALIEASVADDHAWWAIRIPDGILLAVVALETAHGAPVGTLTLQRDVLRGGLSEFDFDGDAVHDYGEIHGRLEIHALPHLGFRLFRIRTPSDPDMRS